MSSVHRVKVYRLSEEGEWLDRGTGHISVEYMEVGKACAPTLRRDKLAAHFCCCC